MVIFGLWQPVVFYYGYFQRITVVTCSVLPWQAAVYYRGELHALALQLRLMALGLLMLEQNIL